MSSFSILTKQSAVRMAPLVLQDIVAIQKLSAVGKKADEILKHIADVRAGGDASVSFSPKGPTTVTIQAYSFLKDENQYGRCGVSPAQATELLRALPLRTQETLDEIRRIYSNSDTKRRGSPRPVNVTLDGAPSSRVPGAKKSGNDGGFRELGEIIAENSVPYGMYSFEAIDTNMPGDERFVVDLGSNLLILAQSKKLAVRAAKIVSINGRHMPAVSKFVFWRKTPESPLVTKANIPSEVWSGQRSAFQVPPASKALDSLTSNVRAPVAGNIVPVVEESDDESEDEDGGAGPQPAASSPQAKGTSPPGGSPGRPS